MIQIRLFRPQDTEQVAHLFHGTVREVNVQDYSVEQVKAWAPDDLYFRKWSEVCSSRFTYVAEDQNTIAGFGELEANGHIDCFYCHKNYQRCGIGRLIYEAIESKARELQISQLFVEASITAKPFFERMGFLVLAEQRVERRGIVFVNYRMEKSLRFSERS
ncbi:MAG: GNAT family N-acetyltransferase [Leptolyngbyaceae cyanobacterium bins.59]|nr:GNAT family N-acetyltransferase [Leptolyngbyaceae cyanobacterium bins.59]